MDKQIPVFAADEFDFSLVSEDGLEYVARLLDFEKEDDK